MRDSALLGLLSFDAPETYAIIHEAMQKETSKILKADMAEALADLELDNQPGLEKSRS